MEPGPRLFSLFGGLIDRLLCVTGAVGFSQGPEFMQQYLQRLGGHLDDARRQLDVFRHTAAQAGLTLEQFISQTGSNPDPAVARLGGVMTEASARVSSLQAAHEALLGASLWERPFLFIRHLDPAIARATGAVYQPAVPTTLEGLSYALAGMFIVLAIYHVGFKSAAGLFRRARAPAKIPA